MQQFPLDKLDRKISQPARDAMLDVILAWARLDSFMSKWMSVAFGTSPDATVILMGNMSTQAKLTKLKGLYGHFGFQSEAVRIAALEKEHLRHVDVRNAIAHVSCVGQMIGDANKVVFMAIKRIKAMPGHTFVEVVHLDQMTAATDFALGACKNIEQIIEELKQAREKSK
jgi:hypothetical protein